MNNRQQNTSYVLLFIIFFLHIKIFIEKYKLFFCWWPTPFSYIDFLQPLKKSSHKNPRSEDALTSLLYFMGVRLRQMCNGVICSRPCQSNAESAGMPRLETLRLWIALVTWHGCFESRFGAVFRNICTSGSRHRVETSVPHQPSLIYAICWRTNHKNVCVYCLSLFKGKHCYSLFNLKDMRDRNPQQKVLWASTALFCKGLMFIGAKWTFVYIFDWE